MDIFQLTAPCGLDCFNCELFKENITDEMIRKVSQYRNMKPESVPCGGCREELGCKYEGGKCDTLKCVQNKELSFCFECDEFPCSNFMPAADGAATFPHNLKLYNLCRMRKIGLTRWAKEEAGDIRKKYFKGKFVIGKGPVFE